MTLKIYKYPFTVAGEIRIDMPAGAQVLAVQVQGEKPCIWALVNPEAIMGIKTFRLYGTGHPIKAEDRERLFNHVGTFQLHGGKLVFHLFETY